ncbi:MAG: hypothetical protein ACKOZU_06440 [Planctomycetaceae bacterium]
MAILVVCPGCTSRFTVSDQYAGKTGPCPKCKKPITVPRPQADAVTIHEPERPTAAAPGSRPATVPFRSLDRPVPPLAFALGGAGAVMLLVAAWLVGALGGGPPTWLALVTAFLVGIPCAAIGYAALRNREMEAYRGSSLLLRCTACAAVYAALWAVRGFLPDDAVREMWQWLVIAPAFALPGALAAVVAFDLDWSTATAHFSFYVLFTSLLRWLAGLPPL